jgi:hypothetical protein
MKRLFGGFSPVFRAPEEYAKHWGETSKLTCHDNKIYIVARYNYYITAHLALDKSFIEEGK